MYLIAQIDSLNVSRPAHKGPAGVIQPVSEKPALASPALQAQVSGAGLPKAVVPVQRPSDEDDLGDQGDHMDGEQMPPQAQAIELLCRCDDIPDDGIELRVLKGLLTAATSTTTHLHGQVRAPVLC